MADVFVSSDHIGQPKTELSAGGAPQFVNTLSTSFDGSNDRGSIAANASLNMSSYAAWSCSLWFKTTTSSGSSFFGCWEYNVNQRQWLIYILNGQLIFFASSNGSSSSQAQTAPTYHDGVWHQAVCVYNGVGAAGEVYVDGSLIASNSSFPALLNVTNPLIAGATSDAAPVEFLNGNIDEIGLWDKALSGAEVTEAYNSGAPTDLSTHSANANLIGWWRMGDGDTFPTVADQVNTNDMTLINMDAGDFVTDTP